MSDKGVFVGYWPCGKCVGGLYLDDPGVEESIKDFLLDTVRERRKIEYYPAGQTAPMKLCWKCECSSVPQTCDAPQDK